MDLMMSGIHVRVSSVLRGQRYGEAGATSQMYVPTLSYSRLYMAPMVKHLLGGFNITLLGHRPFGTGSTHHAAAGS